MHKVSDGIWTSSMMYCINNPNIIMAQIAQNIV